MCTVSTQSTLSKNNTEYSGEDHVNLLQRYVLAMHIAILAITNINNMEINNEDENDENTN